MTGTDLNVNKPHCATAVRPWESEATTSTLGLEPVQSCLGVARVMSEQKVPRSVEQRIVIKFSQGRTAAAHCGLFTYKSVPVIFEPPYTYSTFIFIM